MEQIKEMEFEKWNNPTEFEAFEVLKGLCKACALQMFYVKLAHAYIHDIMIVSVFVLYGTVSIPCKDSSKYDQRFETMSWNLPKY